MKLVLVRDGITYELGVTCTFQLCIIGQVPPELNIEPDMAEELLAQLEQTGFFKHTSAMFNSLSRQEERREHHDTDEDTMAFFDIDVPF